MTGMTNRRQASVGLFRRKKKPTGHRLAAALRRRVLERDGFRCRYCGSTNRLEIDHLTPRARGGKDTMRNLVTACYDCNRAKGARELSGWRRSTKIRRYRKERKRVLRAQRRRRWWALWLF